MNDRDDNHDPDTFIDDLADQLGLGDVMAALADTVAATPPPALRGRVLSSIAERPPVVAAPVTELFALRVAAMSALLDELTTSDWTRPAAPYEWSVHGLVAHLTAVEEYTVRQLGLAEQPPLPASGVASDHLALGASEVAEMLTHDPGSTVRRWRAAAHRVVDHVGGPDFDAAQPVPLHAWPFDAATALVARSFEMWTHADDIRRATGRTLEVPSAAELRTMSSTSVGGLPILLAVTGGPAVRPTRVVLTGPGGGTFDLGRDASATGPAEHLLVADVVDYCRLVARRIDPAELPGQRDGDDEFLDALLRAASAIAV